MAIIPTPDPDGGPTPPSRDSGHVAVLAHVSTARRTREQAERDQVHRVLDWAVVHQVPDTDAADLDCVFAEPCLALAGAGAPRVGEYAAMELAAALGLATDAGLDYLGNAAVVVVEPGEPLGEHESRPGDIPGHRDRAPHRASTRSVAASSLGRGRCSTTDERVR